MMFIKKLFTWWNGQTLNTQIYTWLKGVCVGTDDDGNIFYQSRNGKRRWVIYNGEAEASRISPNWHGWLHYTYDDLPIEKPLPRKDWEKPHQENLTGTALAYKPTGSLRTSEMVDHSDYEAWRPK